MFPKEFSHKNNDDVPPPLKITWGNVTEKNVKQLRVLNSAIFPINYADQFYKDAINSPPGFVKLAYFNEVLVAAVCCRKEIYVANHAEFHNKQSNNNSTEKKSAPHPNGTAQVASNPPSNKTNSNPSSNSNTTSKKFSLYILTLGVLAPYRERGIGKQLIEHVLKMVKTSPVCKDVVDIYLHVQDGNDDALQFYDRYGFKVTEKLNNYYRRIEPADCFVVRKSVNDT